MNFQSSDPIDINTIKPALTLKMFLLFLLITLAGVAAAVMILPTWLPGMTASVSGSQPKIFWFLARSSAIVAYFLIWLSMVLGVSVTNKAAAIWPGLPTAIELHQFLSIIGLFFALFHGLILTGDAYLHPTLVQVLVPFTMSSYRPVSVGIGQVAFYLIVIVTASFYVRKKIGTKTWRAIHYLSFLTYVIALLHGIGAGTDAATTWARGFYWGTSSLLLFLIVYRILVTRKPMVKVPLAK